MTVVIVGTPSAGFYIVGPFDDQEKAIVWAEENEHLESWEVVELVNPEAS
jgi:hypothetical protein